MTERLTLSLSPSVTSGRGEWDPNKVAEGPFVGCPPGCAVF